MERTTVDFGIDLGTTNSVISVSQGGNIETIKNGLSEITPSVVYFDKRGTKRVGLEAAEMLSRPATALDVQAEFKRVMGQRVTHEFKSSGKSMSPEELSAEVLIALRQAAGSRLGSEPGAAVITVPAMFELPQNGATAEAAKLAGFRHSQLLQEPVAAAVAYGFQGDTERAYWLVYDYGGGTFDASIVAIRDGQLTVVKHAGDNYLGGADLDWKVVDESIRPALMQAYSLKSLSRSPKARDVDRGRMLVLKRFAETIKKRLSTSEEVEYFEENVFVDDDGKQVDLEGRITRAEFEAYAAPSVDHSIKIVQKLIEESGIPKASLDRFLLVGGSTFIPLVRQRTAALGIPIGMELDPMTVVSRGAAIFASSQRIPASLAKPIVVAVGAAKLQLEFEVVVRDTEPFVGGKVEIDGKPAPLGTVVSLRRSDKGWSSGDIQVDSKGMFFTSVKIMDKGQSTIEITIRDANGVGIPCTPNSLAITYGMSVAAATLSAGCGIGFSDGRAEILVRSGASLPCEAPVYKAHFVRGLKKGTTDCLKIPILSGDDPIADHNLCGATIRIMGTDISKDLPVGSSVEISLTIDASGVPHARAFIPVLEETFEPDAKMSLDHEPPTVMRDRVRAIVGRLEECEEKADAASLTAVSAEAEALRESEDMEAIEELILAWEQGDPVSAGQARNKTIELSKRASDIADKVDFPATLASYNEELDGARAAAAAYGTASDRAPIDEVAREGSKAISKKDVKMLKHCIPQLIHLRLELLQKDPGFWVGFLSHLSSMQDQFSDRAAARKLLTEGASAAQRRDVDSLKSIVSQLFRMLPRDVADAVKQGVRSDVM